MILEICSTTIIAFRQHHFALIVRVNSNATRYLIEYEYGRHIYIMVFDDISAINIFGLFFYGKSPISTFTGAWRFGQIGINN